MDFHKIVFEFLTLLLISVNVRSLESDNIIGLRENLVPNADSYGYHATFVHKLYVNGKVSMKMCGASFISRQHAVSAAHCLKETTWMIVQHVVLSNQKLDMKNLKYSEYHEVLEVYVPWNWDFTQSTQDTFMDDIGVVKLKQQLSSTDFSFIVPLDLPGRTDNYAGEVGTIAGRGYNTMALNKEKKMSKLNGRSDYQLRYTKYHIAPEDDANTEELRSVQCHVEYRMCGIPKEDRQTSGMLSFGDSGGGLVYKDKILFGVLVSVEEYIPNVPNFAFFANTSYHSDLIKDMKNRNLNSGKFKHHTYINK